MSRNNLTIVYFATRFQPPMNPSDDVNILLSPAPPDSALAGMTWRVDSDESVARFASATLWGAVPVEGRLGELSGTLDWGGTGGRGRLDIQTAGVSTGIRLRDHHLRGNSFFAATDHPAISFDVHQINAEQLNLVLRGELAVRGKPHAFTCAARSARLGEDRIALEAKATFNLATLGMSRGILRMISAEATADVRVILRRAAP